MTVGQRKRHVVVRAPDGGRIVVDPDDHREDVVRRLLERGVTTTTLRALLPDWDEMITAVASRAGASTLPEPLEARPAAEPVV